MFTILIFAIVVLVVVVLCKYYPTASCICWTIGSWLVGVVFFAVITNLFFFFPAGLRDVITLIGGLAVGVLGFFGVTRYMVHCHALLTTGILVFTIVGFLLT